MPTPNAPNPLTEAEYLEIERTAKTKSEFFEGEMFAMAGGSRSDSLIATKLTAELAGRMKGRPCVAFNSDLRVKVEATGLITYPDLSIVCGEQRFASDTLLNPTVLVEVLSDTTEAYDRGKKFEHYRRIPSLKEYILVSQTEPRVELFVRQTAGQWLLREASGPEAALDIPSLGLSLPLADVFANVEFGHQAFRPSSSPAR